MSDAHKKHLPTQEEIDKLVNEAFPTPNAMCPGLCSEQEDLWNALQDPGLSQKEKAQILIRLKAISAQIRTLKCHCPPPQ